MQLLGQAGSSQHLLPFSSALIAIVVVFSPDLVHLRRRQPAPSSSSDDSGGSDLQSCVDAEDEVGETGSGANPTDVNTAIKGGDVADSSDGNGLEWSGLRLEPTPSSK